VHKLYCYVDESGQDTEGQFFIVSVVVTGRERDEVTRQLEQIEHQSGKGPAQVVGDPGRATEKVRPVRDEQASALMRLADALSGFVRETLTGQADYQRLLEWAKERGIIREL
jgi:hypothetical protein